MEAPTFSSSKRPPQPSSSKTATYGGSYGGGDGYFPTSYDDVFGGPPKFAAVSSTLAPRAEDYSEIFSGFRTSSSSRASSSIPVLDLPAINAAEFDDALDYSDVFGGICNVDFAVPFNELFRSSDGFDASDDDDDNAWSPNGTESLSDDSDPFAFSEKSQSFLNGNSNVPLDLEDKKFNVSYHKVNPGRSTCIPDIMHVAPLNDVPVYTCVVEEATSLREIDEERFSSQAVEDIVLNIEAPPILTQKHIKKTSPHSHEGAGLKSLDSEPKTGRTRSVSLSHVNSIAASDINLLSKSSHFTPSLPNSRPSPVVSERNRGINGLSPGFRGSGSCDSEATIDGSLPPFFDMEVDASSSAAVSAAAMKDVMLKAQAKLKAAREFRGRKETLQNGAEVGSETDVNGAESVKVSHTECVFEEKRSHTPSDNGASKMKSYPKTGNGRDGEEVSSGNGVNCKESIEMSHTESVSEVKRTHATSDKEANKLKSYPKTRHGRNVSQILPDTVVDEQPIGVTGKPAPTKCSLPVDTAITDVGGEWKEAKQYFEFVSNDNSRLAYQPPRNGVEKNETCKQQDNNDNDSDSAGESFVAQTNRRRLKPTKVVSRQGYYEKMVKVAQEVHDTVTSEHVETKEGLQDVFHEDCKVQKPKLVIEPEKNEGRVWDTHQAEAKYAEIILNTEAEVKSKNVSENETVETRETDASTSDPLVNMTKEVAYSREGERRVKGTREREESGRGAHDGIVELNTETLKQRSNKENRELKDKRSEGAFGDVFGGERLQTTFEKKEKDKMADMQKMKAECWKPSEVFEDRIAKERLERTCNGQESLKITELQQIYEHEEHLKKATNGQGPELMVDQDVELEKCWEYLEALEQDKSRLNMDKGRKLVEESNSVDCQKKDEKDEKMAENRNVQIKGPKLVEENNSVESQKKHEKVQKLVKMAETGNVQSKFKQAHELRERVFNDEKIDFKEDRNGAFKIHMETDGEDEDWELDSSSDIELSINDKHQKLSNAKNMIKKDVEQVPVLCMLKTPHMKANGSLKVSSQKENGEIDSTVFEDIKMTGLETADVQIDAKESRCTFPQVGSADKKVEGNADPAPFKTPQMKACDSVELSTGKENGDISVVMSGEIRSKTFETPEVIDNRQTGFPASQECHSDDERERRPVYSSSTLPNEKNTKSGAVFATHDQIMIKENRKVAHVVSDPKLGKTPHLDRGGVMRNQEVGSEEGITRPERSQRMNGWNEHSSKRIGGLGAHSVMPDRKPSIHRTPQVSNLSRNIERNGKIIDHNGSLEEKDEDNKTELEKEHLIKLEEEREREREREKDKMAVEVAIREARERAYVDARDRAERAALERATEEARQRAMAEARERLEKACQEAKERSFTDKTSEARLRAERAAVERATAEARQRAIEKAMTDRAMLESRERVQRSVSEKYTYERDVIMRQSSFPSTSERFETASGEPAERCKARLERHRRTVERVAKALEEKNTRDLLAQKEQAERNRFAETLDADIKRWSSGKTGNLRALLSTLQYILGPDSGWQPVPLTEVLTAAAVKKAYRKATLCVHPDKLQQRGASIQQKYTSEKVFDLLKEAWNRFNSEEK